jgi:alpha-tubulin suppressor-like RCC1 family protein
LYGKQINSVYESGAVLAIVSGTATYIAPATVANYGVVNKVYSFGTTNGGLYGNGTTTATSNTMIQSMTGFGDLSWNHDNVVNIYPGSGCVFLLDSSGYVYMCNNVTNNQTLQQATNTSPFLLSNFGSLDGPFITSLAVGQYTTFALDSSGNVHSWGGNSDLGYSATTTTSSVPLCISNVSASPLYGKTIAQIYAFSSGNVAMAIDTSGIGYIWGNGYGSGLPIVTTPFSRLYGLSTQNKVAQLATPSWGYSALDTNVMLYDTNINSSSSYFSNIPIVRLASNFQTNHMGAIDICGNVWMWGTNNVGQLGNNTTTNSTAVPINISNIAGSSLNGKKAFSIAISSFNTNPATIVIDTSGNVHFWGSTNLLTTANNKLPQIISTAYSSLTGQVDVVATLGQATGYLALNSTDIPTRSVWMTPSPIYGSTANLLYPPLSYSPGKYAFYSSNPLVASVSGNKLNANSTGTATITMYQYASGTYSKASSSTITNVKNAMYSTNNLGVLVGNGMTNTSPASNQLILGFNGYNDLSSNSNYIVKIIMLSFTGMALDNCGNVYISSNYSNQSYSKSMSTSDGYVTNIMKYGSLVGTTIVDIVGSSSLSNHDGLCYALDTNGNLHGWGSTSAYGFGIGNGVATTSIYGTPINLSDISSTILYKVKIKQISTGAFGSVILDVSNNVYAWGSYAGNSAYPTLMNTNGSLNGVKVVQVSCGNNGWAAYTLALDSSGQVHFCGFNTLGFVMPTFINLSMIPCSSLSNVFITQLMLNTNVNDSVGCIDSAGNLHMWGGNANGAVGDGTTVATYQFVNVSAIPSSPIYGKQIRFVNHNDNSTVAIDTNGQTYVWGSGGLSAFFGSTNTSLPYCINNNASFSALQNNKLAYAYAQSNTGYFITQNTSASYSVSPTSIPNMQLWLDAQDFSVMTLSGYLVTQWGDKSGLGRDAVPYQTGYPSYSNTAYQSNAAVVMNVNQGMVCPMPAGTLSSGMTCFVVFQDTSMNTGTTNANQTLVSRTLNGRPAPFDMQNNKRYSGNGGSSAFDPSFVNIGLSNGYNLLSFTATAGSWAEYVNGTMNYTSTVMNSFGDSGCNSFYIGTNDRGTTAFTGVLAEVMVYNRILSTSERQSLEG